jgi:hypothetical protein
MEGREMERERRERPRGASIARTGSEEEGRRGGGEEGRRGEREGKGRRRGDLLYLVQQCPLHRFIRDGKLLLG